MTSRVSAGNGAFAVMKTMPASLACCTTGRIAGPKSGLSMMMSTFWAIRLRKLASTSAMSPLGLLV